MVMPWIIYWDNGHDACGTWSDLVFDAEDDAKDYADSVTHDMIVDGIWADEGCAEPYWLDIDPTSEERQTVVEQSCDYFDRYIAGDR